MEPILPGTRGPAVEDIQRRLLRLGYDLGLTGVDGVFLGKTSEAVARFQAAQRLAEDGTVGDLTWAALVDATFTLGDRMLYLRLPHFHGHDVEVLQKALNTLGFSCGRADGIFGAYTEHAVREFQRNCGQPGDGIVGLETVRTVQGLRHVWEGKDVAFPLADAGAPARSSTALLRVSVAVKGEGEDAAAVAARFVNLARATDDRIVVRDDSRHDAASDGPDSVDICLILVTDKALPDGGVPVVAIGKDADAAFAARLATALAAATGGCKQAIVSLEDVADDERGLQRAAVRLLDALCAVLA